ncbi:hypothetical protein CS063_04420 [Sporanaerobium hydrogeniformans]|uniref:Uncharacterized protein n=1 Tax=Sporanaerobium hydrogeniformans TaxID=3072179 RepID=A0AC61DF35_9FIRM|nr:Stk1 family PASTA domain-containing Ser/Thr kinase [Sporanaerobium hydrogeniformans]PHV71806.1 hypothetical protein CS063_04420 [Sporanaerobium hydrogeniformans]
MMLEPGTLLGDRYEIIQKIGAGGMSIVYKAKCNRLQRFVAIKVLREEFAKDDEFVAKFRKEALSAASLSHPNIVGIYDVGSDHDLHYIVMELVEGRTLKEVIAEEGPFNSKVVLDYGVQMVSALRHAHRKKIIHRDIKPQNILITHDSVLKVTDFGIAKAVDSSTVVATGNAIGSVHYFSPEQAKGKYVNETSDLYSCGIVLFELATKKLPFEADSHISIALKHINEEMPHPSIYNPNIMPNLEKLILKATRKVQGERYQNADEMLKDMKGILLDPHYVIKEEEFDDHTILMSAEDTNYIRNNSYQSDKMNPIGETHIPRFETTMPPLQEEEPEEVSTFYKVLASIGGVLATLLLITILSVVLMFWLPSMGKGKEAIVPSFIGKTIDQAKSLAKSYNLKIEIVGEEPSNEATGTVAKQLPESGESVPTKTTIQLTLSSGKNGLITETPSQTQTTKVPYIEGETSVKAEQLLEAADLIPDISHEYDETVEKGKVISQNPKYGATVATGSAVQMVISRGPKVVLATVPDLKGATVQEAELKLRNVKLQLGSKKEEYNDTVEKGKIINQSVAVGSEVEEGSSIDVVVSKGKAEEETTPPTDGQNPSSPDGTQVPDNTPMVTKNFSISAPLDGGNKTSYHVFAKLVLEDGTTKVAYDAVVEKDNFPISIPLKGRGRGLLYTSFDGEEVYQDEINFNEVQ